MMINKKELEEMIKILEEAEPCKIHGTTYLEICIECRQEIQCGECEVTSCQCWNDE